MDAGSLPGWATFGRARPAMATGPGRACVADRRFPVFRLFSHCYFLGPIGGESRSRRLHARPQIAGGNLTSWRHDGSRLGPARTCATEQTAFDGRGVASAVSSLLFTTRFVAHRACNHSTKLSAKGDRRRGAPAQAYLSSSFRFADFASAPQRRVTSRTAPSAYWHF